MIPPKQPQQALHQLLGDAALTITALPGTDLRLWLLAPDNMARAFDGAETRRILEQPPYWSFCWASGLVIAQWLAEYPELVRGKRVLDFGCGSAVAGIAAAAQGAQVCACDLDPIAQAAAQANAQLNGVQIECCSSLPEQHFDLLIAADVLYDRDNFAFLTPFRQHAQQVLLADSRVKNFAHSGYQLLAERRGLTLPDLGEAEEFAQVRLYQSLNP